MPENNTAEAAGETFRCCGKEYGDQFMIQCDNCNDWLHGHCIQLNQAFAKFINKFYCNECLGKDPTLHVTFTKIYQSLIEHKNRSLEEVMEQRCRKCITCQRVANDICCKTCRRCTEGNTKMCQALHCINPPLDTINMTRRTAASRNKNIATIPKGVTPKKNAPAKKKPARAANPVAGGSTVPAETEAVVVAPSEPVRTGRKRKENATCENVGCKKSPKMDMRFCSKDCARTNAKRRLLEIVNQDTDELMTDQTVGILNMI